MGGNSKDIKGFVSRNSIWLILIILILAVGVIQPKFLSVGNMVTLISGEAVRGIMAFGVMFAILSKGIDLTIGSTAALVAVITASFAQEADYANRYFEGGKPLPAILVILIGLAIGVVIGAIYGAIIAYTKIPAFIATLGGQLICRAGAKMYSDSPISKLTESYRFLGHAKIGPVPVIIIVFFLMFAISAFLLTQTRFGKNVFAIGGNDQAARVAGINVERTTVLVYVWCSFCAALGAILLTGKTGSATPASTGLNYELDAIAAATVGGTSHTGGICRASGVLAGILILGVINNGLVMLKVDDNMTNIVKGLIIVGSVILDMRKNAKRV
ncbi:MAG: ABC transporter permease [Blautia sp.]|nr:ABC transporter permease [Blautia sp.]